MNSATTLDQYLRALRSLGLIREERTTRALFEDLFRRVDFTGRRVLDIGGGNGIYSFYAAIMGAREVVCLEPQEAGSSGAAIREFEQVRAVLPPLPVRLETRTVQEYGDAERFDVILMNASINHIDEDACVRLLDDPKARDTFRQVFAHIATLARPSGRLIVVDCTRHNFFAALGLKNPFIPDIEWHKHQAPEVWARLLQEAGFRSPSVSWQPLYRFGKAGERLFSNEAAAYFLKGLFRLEMQKA
jgi:SAM-dependent methyltransferase